ncbi:MAG: folylpolyglutamate synthase/dihydrofolate synthase family protein [Bacteroides sp.]
MNYKETLDYLYTSAPMFQQIGSEAYKEGLENTIALDEHLGHPHREFRSIHVGGTNGKGSCSHTLAAILQSAGYRVGLYTSPHLLDFRERIRINGEPVPETYVIRFIEENRAFFEPLHPSFFELTTAMAFRYFAEEKVEVAIIEVGMGGRLDCTNIIHPDLCIITNIGLDHTQFLGDTYEKIAAEKAGIIKENVPVVIGEATDETKLVFDHKAEEMGAPIIFATEKYEIENTELISCIQTNGYLYQIDLEIEKYNQGVKRIQEKFSEKSVEKIRAYKQNCQKLLQKTGTAKNSTGWLIKTATYPKLEVELGGICQWNNTNTLLHALKQLEILGYKIEEKHVREGFKHVCELTGLMGRWQKLCDRPLVICDTGHNAEGMLYISQQLSLYEQMHMHIVIGMVSDKDIRGMLGLLPANATYYFTKASVKRALSEKEIRKVAREFNLHGNCYPTVFAAVRAAKNKCLPEDFIFVGGSSFIVADLLASRDALNLN